MGGGGGKGGFRNHREIEQKAVPASQLNNFTNISNNINKIRVCTNTSVPAIRVYMYIAKRIQENGLKNKIKIK